MRRLYNEIYCNEGHQAAVSDAIMRLAEQHPEWALDIAPGDANWQEAETVGVCPWCGEEVDPVETDVEQVAAQHGNPRDPKWLARNPVPVNNLQPTPEELVQWRAQAARRGAQVVGWFHLTENKDFSKDRPCTPFAVEVPQGAGIADILAAGYSAGIPRGSGRGGCVEIQTDTGIWSSPTRSRMNPSTAVFKTWEQLEQEDITS